MDIVGEDARDGFETSGRSAVFNLSHSGKYVLCACSDREDVQIRL